jgi:hypothetical protein
MGSWVAFCKLSVFDPSERDAYSLLFLSSLLLSKSPYPEPPHVVGRCGPFLALFGSSSFSTKLQPCPILKFAHLRPAVVGCADFKDAMHGHPKRCRVEVALQRGGGEEGYPSRRWSRRLMWMEARSMSGACRTFLDRVDVKLCENTMTSWDSVYQVTQLAIGSCSRPSATTGH